ncbi:MAG: acyl-CoA dehydrogenase family protein, partial [Rubrivivax sp.]
LSGAKCWCSGADRVDHALLTAWTPEGEGPYLVRVAINDAAGVTVRHGAWQARGMAGSASPDLRFDRVSATRVGRLGDYVARPGFAHGGAGLAACWYGGAVAVATFLHHVVAADKTGGAGPLRQAALGRVARELRACAALLRETAEAIDRDPAADASALALRARLTADDCARTVLDEVSRALGAAPFCRDARFARFAVDLPIFIRQCHGDRDFQALGQTEAGIERPWAL